MKILSYAVLATDPTGYDMSCPIDKGASTVSDGVHHEYFCNYLPIYRLDMVQQQTLEISQLILELWLVEMELLVAHRHERKQHYEVQAVTVHKLCAHKEIPCRSVYRIFHTDKDVNILRNDLGCLCRDTEHHSDRQDL